MKEKIYQIEYQSRAFNTEYSTKLSEARARLESSGFVQMSKLEDNQKINLNEEYWECPEDAVFNYMKAKIVEIKCINEVFLDETLHNEPACTHEMCVWNLNQFCKLPGLCPGRNKR